MGSDHNIVSKKGRWICAVFKNLCEIFVCLFIYLFIGVAFGNLALA
jgi:hypothetical protein